MTPNVAPGSDFSLPRGDSDTLPFSRCPLNELFYINYGIDDVFGKAHTDTITISSALTITNQTFGVSNRAGSFENIVVDGILGLAQVASTAGTLPDHPDQTVPTLTYAKFCPPRFPDI